MRRRLEVRPVALQGQLEETRYRKADDGEYYAHEGASDLWLVETDDGKRGTLSLPRRGAGWTRDGDTYWLTNPGGDRMSKRKRTSSSSRTKGRRRPTTRRKTKRPPPKGFATWSAYMATIRPNSGGTMAGRKKRRRSTRRTTRRKRRHAVARANPPRRRTRRHHRRNPPVSIGGVISRVKRAAIGSVAIVGGEAAARLARSRLFGMSAGTLLAGATELGVGVAAGIAAEKVLGAEIGADVTKGAFAGVVRALAKQFDVPFIAEALGDDSRRRFMIVKGKVVAVPPGGRLAGYVGTGANRPLGGYVGTGANRPLSGSYDDETSIFGP